MPSLLSIFLDFNLPNSTTWFYFSFLLAIALFFKFSRLLSVRNLDIALIFLVTPGLLIVQASRLQLTEPEKYPAPQISGLVGQVAMADSPAALAADVAVFPQQAGPGLEKAPWLWYGYLWIDRKSTRPNPRH